MPPVRIASALGKAVLIALLVSGEPSAPAIAQSPPDLYQPGPDPIAPQLSPANRDPGDEAHPEAPLPTQGATQSDAKQKNDKDDLEMLEMDLKQLSQVTAKAPALDMEVSTVARTQSTVGKSPAAVFVITGEMIRRSGATSIPEVLRMAPGLDVARVDSHTWMITCRGFSDRFANKLLVQIDGRSVYNPLFSGVYWDTTDLMLADVERIEIIRGPGATVWGSNAVNGVINILTKRARDTQGAYASVGGGNHDLLVDQARLGGNNGDGLYWRAYGKHFERGPGYLPGGSHDDWRIGRGGFRVDWEPDRRQTNTWTVQGDYYGGNEGLQMDDVDIDSPTFLDVITPDEKVSGANVLARWEHVVDEDSDWALQTYYNRELRNQVLLRQVLDTFDVDFQHRFPLGNRHALIWGLEFRQMHANTSSEPFTVGLDPRERTVNLFSGFVQDEVTLVDDRLFFTVGSKLENNDFTGFEYQPSGRLLWTPDDRHSIWGAVSRAVRVPSIFEEDGYMTLYPRVIAPGPIYLFPQYRGNPDQLSEDLVAYETGFRTQVSDRFSYDVALFYNVYDNLVSFNQGSLEWHDGYAILPINLNNGMRGETYGVELSADWAVTDRWRVSPCYSFIQMQLHSPARRSTEGTERLTPHNIVYLRSYFDLPRNWELDMALRYVDDRPEMSIPSYITMDVRLGWRPRENLAFSVVGRNLLDRHHYEYGRDTFNFIPTEVQREVYAEIVWRR